MSYCTSYRMDFIAVVIGFLIGRKGYKVMIIVALSRRIAFYFVSLTKIWVEVICVNTPQRSTPLLECMFDWLLCLLLLLRIVVCMILAYPGPFKPSPRQRRQRKRPRFSGQKIDTKLERQLVATIYSGMAFLRFYHKIVPCTKSYFCCYFW